MLNRAEHDNSELLRRSFLLAAALWMVTQANVGSFVAAWNDSGHWPGNICWLLICYCIGHLALGWGRTALRDRRVPGDLLFLAAMAGAAQLLWLVMAATSAPAGLAGLAVFLAQPFLVIAGFAVLHRTRITYR